MNLKRSTQLSLAAMAVLATLGCWRIPSSVAASNTPLEGRSYEVIGNASATTRQSYILGFIPVQSDPQVLADTIEAAKKSSGADAIIEMTVETMTRDYVLFSTLTTEVKGKAIRFTSPK